VNEFPDQRVQLLLQPFWSPDPALFAHKCFLSGLVWHGQHSVQGCPASQAPSRVPLGPTHQAQNLHTDYAYA